MTGLTLRKLSADNITSAIILPALSSTLPTLVMEEGHHRIVSFSALNFWMQERICSWFHVSFDVSLVCRPFIVDLTVVMTFVSVRRSENSEFGCTRVVQEKNASC